MNKRTTSKVLKRCIFFLVVFFLSGFALQIIKFRYSANNIGAIDDFQEFKESYMFKHASEYKTISTNKRTQKYLEKNAVKDWHDYKFIEYEKNRTGPGENGAAYNPTDDELKQDLETLKKYGYHKIASDKVSVNRSVIDCRDPRCKEVKYLADLPSTSVIVIFKDELKSVLLRTIHAILNRTPPELLHEIIMVNDKSSFPELYEPLQKYVDENLPKKVKIINLTERKGLIVTRMEGAKVATGEVLVFFDSHIEVNVNWLPPLLEPIKKNSKIGTCPIIDYFATNTFKYQKTGDGNRGIFEWNWIYKNLPKTSETENSIEPFKLPIMLGCAFAIDRKYFWELGGYDDGLKIWNGENYELSFKLWLCGEGLLEVPCSRVAHTFRGHNNARHANYDFVNTNFKRVAEVWLGDYKEALYSRNRRQFDAIDPGDLTKQKEIRKSCKPFRYFLEEVVPDLTRRYPLRVNHPRFASGTIKSLAFPKFCVDTFDRAFNQPVGLRECDSNSTHPRYQQSFLIGFHKNLQRNNSDHCIDAVNMGMFECHYAKNGHSNQFFKYNPKDKMIIMYKDYGTDCMTADIRNQSIYASKCEKTNMNQKWEFGYVNVTAIEHWNEINGYNLDLDI